MSDRADRCSRTLCLGRIQSFAAAITGAGPGDPDVAYEQA